MASAPQRNLELKAVDPDPEQTLATCLDLGLEDQGVLRQRDTYFHAVQGRLKLREAPPNPAELISYARPDRPGPTVSHYRISPVADHLALVETLADALGVRVVVEKVRRVLVSRNLRIHLDCVTGLGAFVELEAVAAGVGGLEVEERRVEDLRRALRLEDELLVARGYGDLLERRGIVVPRGSG